jgi:tRNA A37 methylthiotransferase MiaB
MLNFLFSAPYEERKVANYQDDAKGLVVDTCAVTDAAWNYETAIKHPEYKDGRFIIVAGYATKAEAEAGHAKWVKKMTAKSLPEYLDDCPSDGWNAALGNSGREFRKAKAV